MSSSRSTLDSVDLDLHRIEIESPRPFGTRFARQNRRYLIDFPLLLIVTGLIIWMVPSNATFVLGTIVGAFAGLYVFVGIFLRGAPVRISTLLAMTILLSYNLGALNSWIAIPRAGLTIAEYFTRDPADLARAIAACLISAALLFVCGEMFERPVFGEEFRIAIDSRSELLVYVSTALILIGYATGSIGFMGVIVDEYGHESPLSALVIWWSAPAFAYSVCATLNSKRTMRLILGACTLVQMLALVPTGRRVFAYTILLSVLASRLGKFRTKLSMFKKLLLIATTAVVISIASMAFLYLRVGGWGHREADSLGTRIRLAYDAVHTRGPGQIAQMLQKDASTRTFILGYFSDLLESSQRSQPLFGADALHHLKAMVPSLISPTKLGNDPYEEEQMVNMHWGFSYIDQANSILTAGASDFGILGVLVYPLLVVVFYRIFIEWIQATMPTFAAVIISLAMINQILLPEQSLSGYFGEVRSTVFFAVILYLFSALPRFQLRSSEPE